MNRIKLIILAAVFFVPIEIIVSKPNSFAQANVICKNTYNLSYKTYLGRRGFFGWLNGDFTDSISAYDEYIKCFAKTKEEKTFSLTLRGLSKQSISNIDGACDDWVLASQTGDFDKGEVSPDPYPGYWSTFKKEYKKEIKLKDHKNAFESVSKKLRNYKRDSGYDIEYLFKTCGEYWESNR